MFGRVVVVREMIDCGLVEFMLEEEEAVIYSSLYVKSIKKHANLLAQGSGVPIGPGAQCVNKALTSRLAEGQVNCLPRGVCFGQEIGRASCRERVF